MEEKEGKCGERRYLSLLDFKCYTVPVDSCGAVLPPVKRTKSDHDNIKNEEEDMNYVPHQDEYNSKTVSESTSSSYAPSAACLTEPANTNCKIKRRSILWTAQEKKILLDCYNFYSKRVEKNFPIVASAELERKGYIRSPPACSLMLGKIRKAQAIARKAKKKKPNSSKARSNGRTQTIQLMETDSRRSDVQPTIGQGEGHGNQGEREICENEEECEHKLQQHNHESVRANTLHVPMDIRWESSLIGAPKSSETEEIGQNTFFTNVSSPKCDGKVDNPDAYCSSFSAGPVESPRIIDHAVRMPIAGSDYGDTLPAVTESFSTLHVDSTAWNAFMHRKFATLQAALVTARNRTTSATTTTTTTSTTTTSTTSNSAAAAAVAVNEGRWKGPDCPAWSKDELLILYHATHIQRVSSYSEMSRRLAVFGHKRSSQGCRRKVRSITWLSDLKGIEEELLVNASLPVARRVEDGEELIPMSSLSDFFRLNVLSTIP